MANEYSVPVFLRALRLLEFPHKLGICERLFARRLSREGICWVKTSVGPTWKLDLRNSTHRWIIYGYYEGPAIYRWAKRNLPRQPVIVDSGANIGQTLLYFGTLFPEARIFAFEPGEYQAKWLHECLLRNPDLPAKVLSNALGEREEMLFLELSGDESFHGGQNVVSATNTGQPIRVLPLPLALSNDSPTNIDLWKLDVEGSEISALKGAREWLEAKKIGALWVETRDNCEEITQLLRDFNYQAFSLRANGTPAAHRDGCDYTLFLPNK